MKRLILIMGGLFTAMNSFAATYTVTQITDDTYDDQYARLNNEGDVVWASWVNSTDTGWTIFEYNGQTQEKTQVSDHNAFFNSHQVNNNGDVVWMASDGHDQEIYLYNAKTRAVVALTDNDNNDTNPQISDNGDVTWLEQQGTTASSAILMRYDAGTMTSSALVFDGATRQGYQVMNAKGDIAWNAVLADSQQILLYNAETKTISNISNNENAIHSNQRIMDNGDVVWETYDLLSSEQGVMYYKAADGSSTQVVNNVGGHLFGSQGNVVWVSAQNGTYTISVYDPASGAVKKVAKETSTYAPNVTGISARGDVTWRIISGTNWISRVYNAQTKKVVDLTNTQRFGTFDLDLADNGDVVWSLWDGNDYEVYSYQGDSGLVTQLTDNQVDDGITIINASGTILWNRFDPTDNELMLAVRDPKPLEIKVKDVELEQHESEASIKATFNYDGLPAGNEDIYIGLDGASLANVQFGDFTSKGSGNYFYKTADVELSINFNSGLISVEKDGIDVTGMQDRSTADVVVKFGRSSASGAYTLQ